MALAADADGNSRALKNDVVGQALEAGRIHDGHLHLQKWLAQSNAK
jgi:hypothetical protein